MTRVSDLHKKWLSDPKYRKTYDGLQQEFVLAQAVIKARKRAGLTQQQLARKMGTTQPVIARLEGGNTRPSLSTLERLADATGSQLVIAFQPRKRAVKRQVIARKTFEVSFNPAHAARKTG
jgi:transcriptional regulator with XRE-family HTH domain